MTINYGRIGPRTWICHGCGANLVGKTNRDAHVCPPRVRRAQQLEDAAPAKRAEDTEAARRRCSCSAEDGGNHEPGCDLNLPDDVVWNPLSESKYTVAPGDLPVPYTTAEIARDRAVERYWLAHYIGATGLCTLCGNSGRIDTTATSPQGTRVGCVNYCICPNGQTLRMFQEAHPSTTTPP